jgi:hypothetical protein
MKKHIIYLALILFLGNFFAGFDDAYAAKQTEEELLRNKLENQCDSLRRAVISFDAKKAEAGFNFQKQEYEKKAYKKEIDARVSLENTLACLKKTTSTVCIDGLSSVSETANKCNITNFDEKKDLELLELMSKKIEKTAKLFEESLTLYMGARHMPLEAGERFNEDGSKNTGLDEIIKNNIITRAGNGLLHSTQDQLHNIFRGNLIKTINRVMGTIAILYLFVLGAKFIMARGDTERISQLKGQFAWITLGLAVISLAEFIGYEVFDPSGGKNVLNGQADANFGYKVRDIVRYFEYMAGGLMLINALISAYDLIMNGEEDESVSREKQFLKSFLMGTAFILLAEVIVRILTVKDGIAATSQIAVKEIAGIVNFALSFVGIIAVTMLVMAGLYYVISFGDEEQTGRAKKMVMASVAGVVISFSAYTIIRFLII